MTRVLCRPGVGAGQWAGLGAVWGRQYAAWLGGAEAGWGLHQKGFCLPELEAQILSCRWEGLLGAFLAGQLINFENFLSASRARKNGLGLMGMVTPEHRQWLSRQNDEDLKCVPWVERRGGIVKAQCSRGDSLSKIMKVKFAEARQGVIT